MATAATILYNGNVLTMTGTEEPAQAVAVGEDGRIVAVGTNADVRHLAQAGVREINLRGRSLLPGFFDCHLHMLWLGINLGHVDLSSPPVRNKQDIIRLLRERLDSQPQLTCAQGNRYDQNKLTPPDHLTRHDLDHVSTVLPVRIVHTSGHAAVVNTRALEMLGITSDTPDPVGGEIVRDASGQATGVLLETASWNDLDRILPHVSTVGQVEALGRANRYLLERGITSASDANMAPNDLDVYARAVSENALRVRTNGMIGWAEVMKQTGGGAIPTPNDLQPPQWSGVNWHRLHVGQAKLFSDGAITTRTCWLRQPFEGMAGQINDSGIPMHPPDELRDYIYKAHDAGWQIATHAIGDRAIDAVLAAYAEAQRVNTRHRPGHRIEHAMLLDKGLTARFRRQNVWSVGQPEFLAQLGDAYVMALGEERADRLSPYATLDAQNVAQAFSSDCPVVPGAPLDGIRAAVERKTPSGRILNVGERLAPDVAVYNYTSAPAYATRTERDRGSLEIGKWADFTLLSADPAQTPLSEWEQVQVVAVFIGGDCLHGTDAL
jgi:predicted amidohydrolase YtcJ